jgi:hypothetical protein
MFDGREGALSPAALTEQLSARDQQVVAKAYGEPEFNEAAKSRFIDDVRSYISGKLETTSETLRNVIKRVVAAAAALGVVFNPHALGRLDSGVAHAFANPTQIVRTIDAPAGAKMSDVAKLTYSAMAPIAMKSGKGFFIADKPNGMIHVFDRHGKLIASAPALYGKAAGDDLARAGLRGV